jgi:hypothetical protein
MDATRSVPAGGTTAPKRPVALVIGILLGLGALSQLVPTLLAVVVMTDSPLLDRLANAALFGVPLAAVLVAAVVLVRHGLGRPTGWGVRATSGTGRWALRSLLAVPVLLVLAPLGGLVRHLLDPDEVVYGFWGVPETAVPLVMAWVAGLVALLLGAWALFRFRDRTASVLATVAIAWIVVSFGLGEMLVPH